MDSPESPNIIEMAKNFGHAMMEWALTDDFATVTDDEFNGRKTICMKCPAWEPDSFGGIGGCQRCGCSVLKLYIPSVQCPDTPPRWKAISGK